MSHIEGHWDYGSIGAAVNKNSAGILSLKDSATFKIVFFNNQGTSPEHLEDGKVGFHLLLIPASGPQTNGKYFALAYDIVPLKDHQSLDRIAKAEYNIEVENLSDAQMDELLASGKLTETEKVVLSQTREYKKTESFSLLYKNGSMDPLTWIKAKVKNYDDIQPMSKV